MKRHPRRPWIEFATGRSCVKCVHGKDYIPMLDGPRRGGTVLCKRHRCRVYALGGSCKDYEQAKEVKDGK